MKVKDRDGLGLDWCPQPAIRGPAEIEHPIRFKVREELMEQLPSTGPGPGADRRGAFDQT